MEVKIRKASKKDIPIILKLFNSSPNLSGDDSLSGYKSKHIMEFVVNPVKKTLVAEVDKKVVGVIVAEFWKIAEFALLDDIVVDKDYQKKGIGFKLQLYIEKLAKKNGITFLYLFSEKNNQKAHKMFKKGGYTKGKEFVFFSKILKETKDTKNKTDT